MSVSTAPDDSHRVVVTGMGIVITLAENLPDYLAALLAGRSGITRWKDRGERIYSKIGGDLSDFDLAAHVSRVGAGYPCALVERAHKLLRATPLSGRVAAAAALQASVDAGWPVAGPDPERVGHVLAGHNLTMRYYVE